MTRLGARVRCAAALGAALVFATPARAATVVKTWTFAASAESYAASTGGQSTAAWDAATGNPAGAFYTEISGRNKSNANFWEWSGTFEDMGVPAGSNVTAVQLTGGFTRCTVFNTGDSSSAGPWELRDSGGGTVLATLYAGRTFTAADGAWVAATGSLQSLGTLPSITSIRVRLNNSLATGASNNAAVRLYDDQVAITVTYTPSTPVTTVGNGLTAEPPAATVAPESGITDLDNFTLKTSSGTDSVTSVTVTLDPANAFGNLQTVSITSNDGSTTYGSTTEPSSNIVVVDTAALTATTAETQYKVRITPKTHAAMQSPAVGQSYATTGTVTAIAHVELNTVTYQDSASGTITVDNLSPGAASWVDVTPGDQQLGLIWSNPADADYAQTIIVRRIGSAPAGSPTEGATYTTASTIGGDPVAYVGSGTSTTDNNGGSGLVNGTSYYYRAFAKDSRGNYTAFSVSQSTGPHQPQAANTTTVGNGTDPASVPELCPGGAATMLDAFTLSTNQSSDTVTSATVTLAAGTSAALSLVEITNDAGGISYGSAVPAGDTPTVTLSPNLTANTSPVQYKVRVTPKTHAAWPDPSTDSADWDVTGLVTTIASSFGKTYNDTTSATVTVDNLSTANPTWGAITPGDGQLTLAWSNPVDADFSGILVLRKATAFTTERPSEGNTSYVVGNTVGAASVEYVGSGTGFTDTGLVNGNNYYYRIFARDACGNWSTGAVTGPEQPTSQKVTAGTATATVDACNEITVSAPFTGDPNNDSSTAIERGSGSNGPWTAIPGCDNLTGASPRVCIDTGLSELTSYYFRVTFTDPDGVNGTNPQVLGPETTPTCAAVGTTTAQPSATVGGCHQITVTAPFDGDSDGDGSASFEYNTSDSFPGAVACSAVSGSSPRNCLVTGLAASTGYWVQVTFADPDGVTGSNPRVTGPHATTACGTGNDAPPVVLFLAPRRDAVVGGVDTFKVQVFDPDGVLTANVKWSVDGGVPTNTGVSQNSNYNCNVGGQTECKVFEFQVDTTSTGLNLADGSHYLTVEATDSDTPPSMASRSIAFTVRNLGSAAAGSGKLLRRTHGAQLCIDCHNLPTHSSQSSSTQYGNWSIDCLTCHTPHRTRNLYLLREEIETPNSGKQTIIFQSDDRAGGANPQKGHLGDYDPAGGNSQPFTDGVCETCHTRTTHHRNTLAGSDHTHSIGARCATCHSHDRGFKGKGCNECHNAPPTSGNHGKHLETGTLPTTYETTISTASGSQYGFACAKCHTGTGHPNDGAHTGASGDAFSVEVIFDASAAPTNPSGSYTPEAYASRAEALGVDGRYWAWSDNGATCSSLYCHSSAGGIQSGGSYAAPIYQTVTWNSTPGSLGCTGCHGGQDAAATMSASHARHINSNGTGGYAFGCQKCHNDTTTTGSSIADATKHVNAVKTDVKFDGTNPAGSYNGVSHTCSTAYCHSNAQASPAYQSPTWHNTTLDAECDSCHGNDATATVTTGVGTIASGKHTQHVNQAGVIGSNFGCSSCHDSTVSGNRTIKSPTGYAFHASGSKDVAFAAIGSFSGGSYAAPNCSNAYCHSSGQATPEYYTIDWNPATTLDCKGCHGRVTTPAFTSDFGEPNHSGINSHRKHVIAATDCEDCHADTTATGAAIKSGSTTHLNGSRDIAIKASWDQNGGTSNYTPGSQTCSSISCHPSPANAPQWGVSSFECRDCHLASGAGDQDVDDYTFKNGTMAKIDQEDWQTHGHGATSNYVDSGNAKAEFDKELGGGFDGCDYCHDSNVRHGTASNPFRLKNVGGGDGKNGACLACHKDGGDAGVDIGAGALNSSLNVGSAHYGSSHRDSPGVGNNPSSGTGGQFCWDCHDPHGDYNYGANERLGYMIQEQPVRDHVTEASGGSGIPTAVAVTPSFYDINGDKTADWGELVRSTLAGDNRYHGLCQVCHTQNNRFRQTDTAHTTDAGPTFFGRDFSLDSTHFAGTSCTSSGCHEHPQGFKQLACNACHNAPPRPGAPSDLDSHLIHYESTTLPTAYSDTTGVTTSTEYGFACATCHNGTHISDTVGDGTSGNGFRIEVAFESKNPGGGFNQEPPALRAEDQGPDGRYYKWSDDPAATCSNLYCHSNAGPIQSSGTYASPTSTSPSWPRNDLTCTNCHGGAGAASTMSASHAKHINPNGSSAYNYGCVQCHDATVLDSTTIKDKTKHVNAVKTDVVFGGLSSGGSYTAASHTCASAYCHSGKDSGGSTVYQSPTWHNTTLDSQCDSCHGNDANATASPGVGPIASGKHNFHVNNAGVLGTNFGCVSCHNATVSGNQTILAGSGYTQHVDGGPDVGFANVGSFSGGTYASPPTCSNVYCHSSGQATPTYRTVNWTESAWATVCNQCHGTGSTFGEPNYANGGPGQPTANSHTAKHISSAADCAKCHVSTTANGTAIASGSTIHLDGSRQVTFAGGGSYDAGTKTCGSTGNGCHGPKASNAQWGGTPTCLSCHGSLSGETDDLGSSFWTNNVTATINESEWTYSGHGRTAGSYDTPGDGTPNPAAALPTSPTPGTSECLYCHDSGVNHKTASNPFRLRNTGGADGQNGNCLACHKTGSTGVTPSGQSLKNGTVKVDTAHDGDKHTAATMGGKFCWDCHDPHGDRPSATDANGNNIVMIQRNVQRVTDGTYGYLGASGSAQAVEYYTKATPAASDTAVSGSLGKIVELATALGSDHKGICQACHDPTLPGIQPPGTKDWTKYWERTGYDDPDGPDYTSKDPPDVAPYRSGRATAPAGHNASAVCTTCHDHTKKFAGAGGDCLSCHGDAGGAGTQGNKSRRDVRIDFGGVRNQGGNNLTRASHHAGASDIYTQPNMGGALTNFDCVVCHAEGMVDGTGATAQNANYHDNDIFEFRNVDQKAMTDGGTGNVFVYDKDAVATSAGAAANWNSTNTTWRVQTSGCPSPANSGCTPTAGLGLDGFCLTCHDYNGAVTGNVGTYENRSPAGTQYNPFGDDKITNEYDQVVRHPNDGTGYTSTIGRVTDIASHAAAAWTNGPGAPSGYSATDRDAAGEARYVFLGNKGDGRADPPLGVYSRHAIRGRAVSVYGSTTGGIPSARWASASWNDTSVMGCADCHLVDGSSGAAGNAHGASSEYLLKDGDGGALEGYKDWAKSGGAQGPYICFKCHNATYYDGTSKSYDHTGNTSDWVDTTQLTAPSRTTSNGNFWGEACGNCHAGAISNTSGTPDQTRPSFGTIHGTSQKLRIQAGTSQREAYRFMSGSSMRYFNPGGWNAGASVTCFTLNSGEEDSYGGCVQHSYTKGGGSFKSGKPVSRNLSY